MKRAGKRVDISKFLSLILRHKPDIIGLPLDEAGWGNLDELMEKASKTGVQLSKERIRQAVAASDKQRFAISEDGLRIRANQGHSIVVDLGFEKAEPPELLYHGTASHNLAAIRQQGIVKGNRQYVHLSLDKESAEVIGKRHGKPIVLVVKAGCMHQDGFKFFLSANGVWLTDHVPHDYVSTFKA